MEMGILQTAAVILAGGLGTRVRHLLPGTPKPMAPVMGRPFLEWMVRYLAGQGLTRVVISTGYLAEVIHRHFGKHTLPEVEVRCVEETVPLGTGGGLLHASRQCGWHPQAWWVLNGDTLSFSPFAALLQPMAEPGIQGTILARWTPDASRYGRLRISPAGELQGFGEKQAGQGMVNAGVYLLRQALLDRIPRQTPLSLERDVFPNFTGGTVRLKVVAMDAPFLDIGTPETLAQAEAFLRQNEDKLRFQSTR
jgi:D-glycero-alpha-D-manno-heptose 1-phosphate guanylyltransferase